MAGFSVIHEDWVEKDITTQPAYHAGNALGWLYRGNKQAATNHALSGRLYLAKSGWLLLSVPNALVRGVYDALAVPGVELPKAGLLNVPNVDAELLNAHISVMTADEVKSVGEDRINERGHAFCYSLGSLREIDVRGIEGISKVWVIEVSSPELSALRRTYGLSALPKENQPFHITVAVRKKNVLYANETGKGVAEQKPFERPISRGELKAAEFSRSGSKLSRSGQKDLLPGGKADNVPDREISPKALAEGQKDEHEHTRNDQIAKEIAKDHLLQDPQHYKKETLMEKVTASQMPAIVRMVTGKQAGSVYGNQALNFLNAQQPIRYDHTKPVFQNIQNQLTDMKQRGDFMMQAQRNHDMYMSALSPQFRHKRMLQAFRGELPQPHPLDTFIEHHGDQILGMLGGQQ